MSHYLDGLVLTVNDFENIFAYLIVFANFHHVQTPNIFKALNIVSMKIFYKRKVFASVDTDLVSQRINLYITVRQKFMSGFKLHQGQRKHFFSAQARKGVVVGVATQIC